MIDALPEQTLVLPIHRPVAILALPPILNRDLLPPRLHHLYNPTHEPIPPAVHRMEPRIDLINANPVLTVNNNAEREHRRDNRRERSGGRDHEHDDHLQTRGLLHGGASEDRACHHARDGYDAEDAVGVSEVCGRRRGGKVPHLVDVGREGEAQGVGRDGFACFEACCAEREICFYFVPIVAVCEGTQSMHSNPAT